MKRITTGFKGIIYYENPKRKNNGRADRRFLLRFRWQGKQYEEAVGWASEGWNAVKASNLLAELRRNQLKGEGPCSLKELREANEAAKAAEKEAEEEAEKTKLTFKQFFEEVYLPDARTRWKPQTTEKAIQHVKNWIDPVTGERPLKDLGLSDVNQIKANLSEAGRSPRHIQYVFRTFSMIWASAFDFGLVESISPTKNKSFRLPKVDNEKQRYLTQAETSRLLAAIKNPQVRDMALLSLETGMRFGEIAALTWGSVDIDQGIVRVLNTKSGRDRNVPMTTRAKKLFQAMPPGILSNLVFPSPSGRVYPQTPSCFNRAVKTAGLNDGIDEPKMRASFHTLRHTFASRLVQGGVDLFRVQKLLGHSTPAMTARYSKLADNNLREAIEAMESKESK